MTWTVRLMPPAQHDLASLPAKHQAAALNYIFDRLPDNPLRMSKPLRLTLEGSRVARVGPSMRVVFRLVGGDVIEVDRVDYRADVYRGR